MKPGKFCEVIGGKRYNTETATLVAHDCYWDDHNFERQGRNQWLYRTPKGAYFTTRMSFWQGERDTLTPVSLDEAIALYEGPLSEHELEYDQGFPGVTIEEA